MRFHKKVEPLERDYLAQSLDTYEREMAMTKGERMELYQWVSRGNSPYDNPSLVAEESGRPMDFVSAMRFEEARYQELKNMTPEELDAFFGRRTEQDDCVPEEHDESWIF